MKTAKSAALERFEKEVDEKTNPKPTKVSSK